MQISGSGALVSGGASGLGEATVRALKAKGAVVTIFDRDEPRASALAGELGGGTSYAVGDVTDPEAVAKAVEQAAAGAPLRIDVNCAGIAWVQRTIGRQGEPHDLEVFKTVVSVNLIGTFNVMRFAAGAIAKTEPLKDGERGVVVNTASVAAFEGQIGQIAYAASKGGIAAMTVPAARDLSVVGIRVNTIAPGIMDTPLLGLLPEENTRALGQGVLFPKRLGTPGEFAALAVAIIENGYLNGETFRLDGGLRMPPK
jgi:NAD(P)-dependent dehydrogenase (short-subunit alcohol dehydrogenase family)